MDLNFHKCLLNFRHWTYLWRWVTHRLSHRRVAEGAAVIPHPLLRVITIGYITSKDVIKRALTVTLVLQKANSNSSVEKVTVLVVELEAVTKRITRMFSWQLCMSTSIQWWRTRKLHAVTRLVVWRREASKSSPLNPLCCLASQVAKRRIATKPVGPGAATARSCIRRMRMLEEVASMHQIVCDQELMQLPA